MRNKALSKVFSYFLVLKILSRRFIYLFKLFISRSVWCPYTMPMDYRCQQCNFSKHFNHRLSYSIIYVRRWVYKRFWTGNSLSTSTSCLFISNDTLSLAVQLSVSLIFRLVQIERKLSISISERSPSALHSIYCRCAYKSFVTLHEFILAIKF